jgi:ABC-2 type transport system permease protein
MIGRIYSLLIKEMLSVWRDKRSRYAVILPPILQLFIFATAATLDVKNVPIGILNRDNGEKAFELVQRFHGAPCFSKIVYLKSVDEIAPFIDQQKGLMVLSIDEQFSRNLNARLPADVQIILDGRRSNTTQILFGYASTIINRYNDDFSKEAGIKVQQAQLSPRNWYNPNLLYYWYNVPCLCGLLSMSVTLVITSLSVAREKELGTFDQLLVSPCLPFEILIGKSLPAIIIGMAEATIIILAAIFIFKIPFTGHLSSLYLNLLVFITSIVGVGLFISSLCFTQQQSVLGTFIFMVPATTLSGFATPIENMPQWLQYATYLNPMRYFLIIAKGSFLKAMPHDIVYSNTWQMALIACFTLTSASWLFRRRLE